MFLRPTSVLLQQIRQYRYANDNFTSLILWKILDENLSLYNGHSSKFVVNIRTSGLLTVQQSHSEYPCVCNDQESLSLNTAASHFHEHHYSIEHTSSFQRAK